MIICHMAGLARKVATQVLEGLQVTSFHDRPTRMLMVYSFYMYAVYSITTQLSKDIVLLQSLFGRMCLKERPQRNCKGAKLEANAGGRLLHRGHDALGPSLGQPPTHPENCDFRTPAAPPNLPKGTKK